METRDRPYLAGWQGGLIALVGPVAWEELNATQLGKLNYAPSRLLFENADSPFRRGSIVAVRTAEGRYAKFRILAVGKDYGVDVEWVVYPPHWLIAIGATIMDLSKSRRRLVHYLIIWRHQKRTGSMA